MLPEIYSTVDMIMKGRPLLVLLLFAASAVILAGMYYAATREGTTTRQDKWAGVLSDLDACSRRKHVKSAQYDHFAGIARQEREHDAERLFRAMAHAERLQEYNCANAIVRLGGRYAPPEHVTVFRGTTDDNLRRSIDFARRPPEGLHADDIERALQSGNRYAARVLIWARSGDMRHLALMETCRRRLAANGPAGAQGNIAGRRANNDMARGPANGTAINSENSTARNSASETAHYRANGAAHRADKGKARGPAYGTARDSERGTADGFGNSRSDATADNAPKGYLVCPTCGNIYPAGCSDSYCPCCLTDGRRFVAFEE
ncbi:rubrerythrin family protein [Alistipes finegoldii]|uniref:Rubrerythrin family protein n=2 Tax=Alistipes finegoldii TaxID=214856 RepID=A0AAE4LLW9_9BACT|nr:rubrerythrin family protein [Alistipes finegoldii]MCG4957004.1 rubrerythrin family protein [Alistipes finegoldii]MDU0260478.1 rubrerythrin family protein [Alistipes finegoldii]